MTGFTVTTVQVAARAAQMLTDGGWKRSEDDPGEGLTAHEAVDRAAFVLAGVTDPNDLGRARLANGIAERVLNAMAEMTPAETNVYDWASDPGRALADVLELLGAVQ